MPILENLRIYSPPGPKQDALGLWVGGGGLHFKVKNSVIDLSGCDLDTLDEAVSITWGSSAEFENCLIRGAGKLVLCGSGDEHMRSAEQGKAVSFRHCLLEDFSRRGPEVQSGMIVHLDECLIRNWGIRGRFDVRGFAGWAHDGGQIYANRCVFMQDSLARGCTTAIKDTIGHVGQAVNENGIWQLFKSRTWLSGRRRALTAGPGGEVSASSCGVSSERLVLDDSTASLELPDTLFLIGRMNNLRSSLLEATHARPTVRFLPEEDRSLCLQWFERCRGNLGGVVVVC